MNIIDSIAQGDYFKFNRLLDEPAIDVLQYAGYIADKNKAELYQQNFLNRQRK